MENNQQSVISQIYGKDGTEFLFVGIGWQFLYWTYIVQTVCTNGRDFSVVRQLIGTRSPKRFRILCVTPQTNSTKPIAFLCPVRYNNKIVIRQNMSIGKKKDKRRQES